MQYQHFSIEERERIQQGLWEKQSLRAIARSVGRSHSSVLREVKRNLPPIHERYTPRLAQERAVQHRTHRGRTERLKNDRIRTYVISHLKRRWSPEQIAGSIRHDLHETISHEAIYQYIYAQIHRDGWGLLRPGHKDLRLYLRRRRKRRLKKGARKCRRLARFPVPSIDDRPSTVNHRSRIGDWESDTVESRDHAPGINTLVERKTGLVYITKLQNKSCAATRTAIAHRFAPLPPEAKRTITFDNGPENRGWQELQSATGSRAYFAHPYHSWERGTNENTNGLIRDYFPKGTDFGTIPDEQIAFVEHELNNRPRKRLDWKTPLQVFGGALAG